MIYYKNNSFGKNHSKAFLPPFFQHYSIVLMIAIFFNIQGFDLYNYMPSFLKEKSPTRSISPEIIKKLIYIITTNRNMRIFLALISRSEGTNTKNNEINRQHWLKNLLIPEIDNYNILYKGARFTSFAHHPNAKIRFKRWHNSHDISTAAGRYQIINPTWQMIHKNLQLTNMPLFKKLFNDVILIYFNHLSILYQKDILQLYKTPETIYHYVFGPFFQDLGAAFLCWQKNAISDIIKGNFMDAYKKVAEVWSTISSNEKSKQSYYKNMNEKATFSEENLDKLRKELDIFSSNYFKTHIKNSTIKENIK